MLTYYENLYLGKNVEDIDYIKQLLYKKTAIYDIFLICLNKESNSLMEMFHTMEIFKPFHNKKKYLVIGIANGRKEMKALTCEIIADYFKKNNSFTNFKKYFLMEN